MKTDSFSRFKQWRYFQPIVILLALIFLFLLTQWVVKTFQKPGHMGILESQTMEMTVQPPDGVMPVETERILAGPFISSVTYTGTAVAYNDIPLFPRVEGWITAMPVYPGDRVRKGQLLVQLDTRELTSRVQEAEFGRAAATQGYQAAVQGSRASGTRVQRAQQAIQAARANLSYWQNEIERARVLEREEVITREEFEREQSQFEAAESEYNQALAELQAAEREARSSVYQAQSQRAQAQQAAQSARTQRIIKSYATITAPKSGIIAERLVSPGTLVRPDMQIMRLVQINPIRIQAHVAEQDLNRIRVGDRVRVWDQRKATPVEGQISSLFPAADVQTRTSVIEAVLPNATGRFIPGDYVIVAIEVGEKRQALSVPEDAVITLDQQKAVWIAQNGKARLRYVTTGGTSEQRVEIVQGLKEGDIVITRGQEDLVDGVGVASAEYGPEGLRELPKALSTNRLSPENNYRIRKSLEHQVVTIELSPKPPQVGQNELSVVITSAHGVVSDNLSLEMTTVMPAMPSMASPKPRVKKLGQGRFRIQVLYSMPGLWQMNLAVKEGRREIARFAFETRVPD